jgi:hypothetical protein
MDGSPDREESHGNRDAELVASKARWLLAGTALLGIIQSIPMIAGNVRLLAPSQETVYGTGLALVWLSNLLLILALLCSEAAHPTQFEADSGSLHALARLALIGAVVCVLGSVAADVLLGAMVVMA